MNKNNENQWPKLLNIKKAALYSGLPIWCVRQTINNGKIPFLQIGHTYYVERADIDNFIRDNKKTIDLP